MPPVIEFYGWVEDAPSQAVAHALFRQTATTGKLQLAFRNGFPAIAHGFGNIKKKAPSYLKMASDGQAVFIMTDLDSGQCAPSLLREWLKQAEASERILPERFVFRVAVREVESWLMADTDGMAKFFGIPKANFPSEPDGLDDPKEHLLGIIRRKGKRKWHKEMLPSGRTASIGPTYNGKLCEFINGHWDPVQAASVSPSLNRAVNALSRLVE